MDDAFGTIIICVGCFLVGLFVGCQLTEKNFKEQAIKHNAAYYNTTTANFEWRTNLNFK